MPKVLLALSTLGVTLDFLLIRLPLAFSSPDVLPLTAVSGVSGFLGITCGVVTALLSKKSAPAELELGFLVASLLAQICPWLYWLSFDGRLPYLPVFVLQPFVSGLTLGYLAVFVVAEARATMTPDELLRRSVSPVVLSSVGLFLFLLACSQSFVGLLLYGSLMGAIHLVFAAWTLLHREPMGTRGTGRWVPRILVPLVFLLTLASAGLARRVLPLRIVHESTHRVVHYSRGRTRDLRVTSGQDAFHVFEGNRLRFTTLDQQRWAEALTQPAFSRLQCPKKVLVFSQGEGLAERELLKMPCVESVTSVVRDRVAVDAGRRQYWWRHTISNAWDSPRVHVIEQDPAVWLSKSGNGNGEFDIAIIDLPDPENFVDTKYYTRFFYRQLARVLAPHSLVVTQATSALRTPKTFASIRVTLEAAGYSTRPFHVELTTLGDWYFILASPGSMLDEPSATKAGAVYSFSIPPDATPRTAGKVSRLEEPAALDSFLEETGSEPLNHDEGQ